MKVTVLLPYEYDSVPGQRFRWEQWESRLASHDVLISRIHFLSEKLAKKRADGRTWGFVFGVILRYLFWFFACIFRTANQDVVVVFRNAAIAGPPLMEVLLSALGRTIVYDFDDAIFLPPEGRDRLLVKLLRCDWRVGVVSRRAAMIGVGSSYLADYAEKYCSNTRLWPTSIDTQAYNRSSVSGDNDKLIVGWTGSSSTASYIEPLLSILAEIQKKYDFDVLIIGASFNLDDYDLTGICIPWSPDSEVQNISRIDIGLMPLLDTPWAKGKCALKALQYSALGIPAVVSNVGENSAAVRHGVTGYLVEPGGDWTEPLCYLLENRSAREEMGAMGRSHVEKNYSAAVVSASVASDLKSLVLK